MAVILHLAASSVGSPVYTLLSLGLSYDLGEFPFCDITLIAQWLIISLTAMIPGVTGLGLSSATNNVWIRDHVTPIGVMYQLDVFPVQIIAETGTPCLA